MKRFGSWNTERGSGNFRSTSSAQCWFPVATLQPWYGALRQARVSFKRAIPRPSLTFSSDCRQLYDLRRTHMNVWQPSALLRMAEPIPNIADLESDWDTPTRDSLNNTRVVMEEPGSAPRVDPNTVLSPRPIGTLFCVGTARGVVTLHEANFPSQVTLELHRSASYHSIEQIAWSNDGSRVCYADVSRTIRVDSIVLEGNVFTAKRLAQMTVHQLRDNITQTITTTGNANTSSAGDISNDGPRYFTRWLPHPYTDGLVMKVSATNIEVLSWATLERVSSTAVIDISPTPLASPLSSDPALSLAPIHRLRTAQAFAMPCRETSLEVLISPPRQNAYFLLTFSHTDSPRAFTIRLWRLERAQSLRQTDPNLTVTEVVLPAQVATLLTRPLGFLNVPCSQPRPTCVNLADPSQRRLYSADYTNNELRSTQHHIISYQYNIQP
ncbi:hypothetical protein V8F33_011106 [Rhypophila sp. PSN 637]